jgi:phage terminase large subunit
MPNIKRDNSQVTKVKIELRGVNYDLMTDRSRELLVSGPAGTGKTQAALLKLHLLCMSVPGLNCLVLRKTQVSLVGSTMKTFKDKVAVEALKLNYVKYYGGSGSEPAAYRYFNGSAIMVGGLDKRQKYLSMEFDLILIDEAIECDSEDLDILVTRLRHGVLPYQQLILLTNPGAPSHHLKIRADTGRCKILYGRHEDNPAYWDGADWTELGRAYLDRLESLPTIRRQRYLLGQWVAAEGLIYEDFDPAVHIAEPFPKGVPPAEWDRFISVDFGFNNPFVAMWVAVSPDDRLYVYRELYQTGMLVEDAAKQVKSLIERDSAPPSKIICDHDAEDRATLERHTGRATIAAKKEVKVGIEAVQARLKLDGKGFPRLYVCRNSVVRRDPRLVAAKKPTCLEEEITTYVWDQRTQPGTENLRESPVKADDHSCDALRYAVMHKDHGDRLKFRSFDAGRTLARRGAF